MAISHKKLLLWRGLALDERGWNRDAIGPQGWRWYQAERVDHPVSMLAIRCDNRDGGKRGAPKMEIHIPDHADGLSPAMATAAAKGLAILFGKTNEEMDALLDESSPAVEVKRERECKICGFVERVVGVDEIPRLRRVVASRTGIGSYCAVECCAEAERRAPIKAVPATPKFTPAPAAPAAALPRYLESRAERDRRLLAEHNAAFGGTEAR